MATSWKGGTEPESVVSTASVDHSTMVVPPMAVARRTLAAAADAASPVVDGRGAGGGTSGTAALVAQTTGRSS